MAASDICAVSLPARNIGGLRVLYAALSEDVRRVTEDPALGDGIRSWNRRSHDCVMRRIRSMDTVPRLRSAVHMALAG